MDPVEEQMALSAAGATELAVPGYSHVVRGTTVVLTNDQAEAVRVSNEPNVAEQAARGTGKTMVGAIIAALIASRPPSIVARQRLIIRRLPNPQRPR
ncbi:unnamed protein product [Haemonchus placei]|uniref:ResIII domain-containing protein n=1 Tax=Haemonchus placei TaxID=6290 RepID=A0A0N4W0K6_HAEPC|nr:unnamed protein product [Haemonchus placei]